MSFSHESTTRFGSRLRNRPGVFYLDATREALYWSVTDPAKFGPEARVKRMIIRAQTDKVLELKNPQCTLPGVKLELRTKEPGKVYELAATVEEVPAATASGTVSFETSATQQGKIDVSAIITVYKPAAP